MTVRTTMRLSLSAAATAALLGIAPVPARAQIGGVGSAGVPGAGGLNTSGAGTGLSRPNAGGVGVQPLTGNGVGSPGLGGAGIASPGVAGPGVGVMGAPGLGATQPVTGVPSASTPLGLVPRGRPH